LLFFWLLILGCWIAWSIWQTPDLPVIGVVTLFGTAMVIILIDHLAAYIATEGAMVAIRQLHLSKYMRAS
jgi:hypothetical protein